MGRTFPSFPYVVAKEVPHVLKQSHKEMSPAPPSLPLSGFTEEQLNSATFTQLFIPASISKGASMMAVCGDFSFIESEEFW